MGHLGPVAGYIGKKITWEDAMNSQQALRPDPSSYHFDLVTPVMEVATRVTSFK